MLLNYMKLSNVLVIYDFFFFSLFYVFFFYFFKLGGWFFVVNIVMNIFVVVGFLVDEIIYYGISNYGNNMLLIIKSVLKEFKK